MNKQSQKIQIGNWTIWPLYDGYLKIDQRLLFDLNSSTEQDFIIQMQVYAYLIDTGNHLILVDTGCGIQFGPTTGFLVNNLRKTGHDLDQISLVLMTHLHLDHIGGLIKDDGTSVFPKATICISASEVNYWQDPIQESKAHEANLSTFPIVQKLLSQCKLNGSLRLIQPEELIIPGVTAVEAFGHTPGHMAFLFCSKNERLLLWGDLVHIADVQFAKPELLVKVDTDPQKAAINRQHLFEKAATEKLLVGGAHLPGSGLGYVSYTEKVFTWNKLEFSS